MSESYCMANCGDNSELAGCPHSVSLLIVPEGNPHHPTILSSTTFAAKLVS
jgi:hypothetical protein